MTRERCYLDMADFLIPAHRLMPAFSAVCSWADAMRALDFRPDLREAFERGAPDALPGGAEAHLAALNRDDGEAFAALTAIAIATYYMNPEVRRLIGYPGQESVSYDAKATQSYLIDGSLGRVVTRGRKYRPTPGL